jgi:GGDEF domain-containing protein
MKNLSHHAALALLNHCPLAILVMDDSGRIQGFNRAFAALLGEAATTLSGDSQPDGLVTPLLGNGTLVNWIMPDGDERWLAIEAVDIAEPAGLTVRCYRDVTEKLRLKKERDTLQQEINKLSLQDQQIPSLLSLYGIQISLDPLVSRSRRYNSPLSLLCIGIDTGVDRDKAIKRVSYLLKDQTRWADLVGCNSNRDFILILQETTQDAALQLVDKLVPHIQLLGGTDEAGIKAYFGITQCQRNDDAEAMLERAVAALAEARQNDTGTAIAI